MLLNQAIEVVEDILTYTEPGDEPEKQIALRICFEAAKAVRSARANNYYTPIPLLPGETEE